MGDWAGLISRWLLCCSLWQFLQILTQTLLQVGLGPGLDGHAMAADTTEAT